ncbi:MAG: hypothetical protein PHG63_00450 [Candidatus Dojkabacteria bacterium]|nr:hypothetical protein [Candidatus Dojkabacteria bacterium]
MRVQIRTIGKIVLPVVLAVVVFLGLSTFDLSSSTQAYETSCPAGMDPEACLDFLQEQAQLIQSEKEGFEQSVNAENFEQSSLSQQISYLNSLIQETELKVAEKTVAIEQNTVEIQLLGKEIVSVQNSIDTLTQEIALLEDIMRKRTKTSYKMTFMSPLEVLLDSSDFETLMRRMKYLVEAKKKDRQLLTDMAIARDQLSDEEAILADKRMKIQEKRNTIENEKLEIAQEEKNLESQKAQQQVLLAESQRREAEYTASLAALRKKEESVNQVIAQLIMQMFESGQLGDGTRVEAGHYIGFQGHTGYSYGSHLHFSVNNGTKVPGWGYFWGNIAADSYISGDIPLSGSPRITQWYHQGYSIDLVSTTAGNQADNVYGKCWDHPTENQCYYASRGSISCDPSYEGWLPLEGEGAPVRAIMGGTVYYGVEQKCGGYYAMVVHDNGYVSIYLHIRPS